ncbi:PhzF family phenazine biosynthesis protein [Viridibacillus sp. YIM B01967]|uniref:PhzF family phenazine biosynthesis protein n=1 Tax=Viridibacillus soli TaxID=2798301 RepID=A0ABS1H6S8_9BACL|nr:PhzF family phenazine biosynthesis protein [Viridibacillus soli]MBK3495106.1 PhzF family phenazine biosynthesis protein [Viridibacillus soli]
MVNVYMFEVQKNGHKSKPTVGVVFEGNALTDSEMQEVAMKTGLAQTIFIIKSKIADMKLRYFTPMEEVKASIDSTMAIVHALEKSPMSENKEAISVETNVGIFPLQLYKQVKKAEKSKQVASHSFNECKKAPYLNGASHDSVLHALNGCAVEGVKEPLLPIPMCNDKAQPIVNKSIFYLNLKEQEVASSLFASSFFLIAANNINRYNNEMFNEKLNIKAVCRLKRENISIVRIIMNAPHIASPIEIEGMTFYLGQRFIPISI